MTTITPEDLTILLRQSSPRLHVTPEPDGKLFVTGYVDIGLLTQALNLRTSNAPEAIPTSAIVPFISELREGEYLEQ